MLGSKDVSLLHDFAVVCREGNLTRAARELNTVQSAVTQRMKRLEDAMGTRLLKRHSRGVTPTEQGQILLRYARKLNTLVADATAEVGAWEASPSGAVSIGLPPSVSTVLTSPLIEAVKTALPNVELTVAEAFSGYLSGWLENDEIDLGFVFDRAPGPRTMVSPLMREELYLITLPETARRLPASLGIGDLCSLSLVGPSRRHGLRRDLETAAEAAGRALDIVLEVDAGYQLIRQVLRGVGSCVLARSAVMPELQDGTLAAVPISNPRMRRTVCLARKREKSDSYLLARIEETLKTVVTELVEGQKWPGELVTEQTSPLPSPR